MKKLSTLFNFFSLKQASPKQPTNGLDVLADMMIIRTNGLRYQLPSDACSIIWKVLLKEPDLYTGSFTYSQY
jgi:hypothetical protein